MKQINESMCLDMRLDFYFRHTMDKRIVGGAGLLRKN
jgi:hypothetical protein